MGNSVQAYVLLNRSSQTTIIIIKVTIERENPRDVTQFSRARLFWRFSLVKIFLGSIVPLQPAKLCVTADFSKTGATLAFANPPERSVQRASLIIALFSSRKRTISFDGRDIIGPFVYPIKERWYAIAARKPAFMEVPVKELVRQMRTNLLCNYCCSFCFLDV